MAGTVTSALAHLKEILGRNGPGTITREDFQFELAEMGLLGRTFSLWEYVGAVERKRGIGISIQLVDDLAADELNDELSTEGHLAELNYNKGKREAIVWMRKSLLYQPWPAFEMNVYHELSHLAADHASHELSEVTVEREAKTRAKWLLLASLCPEIFATEGVNRVL